MCNAGERAMADDRQEWFLKQIFNHGAALHRYLRRFTSGAEDVEDLVQETYVRIFALADSKGIVSPRALLFRVAHNLAVERARRRIGRATESVADFELLGVSTVDPSPEEQIDARRRFESFCAAQKPGGTVAAIDQRPRRTIRIAGARRSALPERDLQ
jgi:DNA-directed RNA polymerase specialized sigma24 family protein